MVRETIDIAIKQNRRLEIVYSKEGSAPKVFVLSSVTYSKYGNNYITGFCGRNFPEMTFRIDKIQYAELEWTDVFPPKSNVNRDGLYLVTCRGDNCLDYELRNYNKCDDIIKPYENSKGIRSIYCHENLLAYHFIPYYKGVDNIKWFSFENNVTYKFGYYIIAYKLNGYKKPTEDDWDYERRGAYSLPAIKKQANTECQGISYSVLKTSGISEMCIHDDTQVLAYSFCSYYDETDHGSHWDMAEKLGIINHGI